MSHSKCYQKNQKPAGNDNSIENGRILIQKQLPSFQMQRRIETDLPVSGHNIHTIGSIRQCRTLPVRIIKNQFPIHHNGILLRQSGTHLLQISLNLLFGQHKTEHGIIGIGFIISIKPDRKH